MPEAPKHTERQICRFEIFTWQELNLTGLHGVNADIDNTADICLSLGIWCQVVRCQVGWDNWSDRINRGLITQPFIKRIHKQAEYGLMEMLGASISMS